MTNSHEVGHALGLRHDGLGTQSYHPGTGSGEFGLSAAPPSQSETRWQMSSAPARQGDVRVSVGPKGVGKAGKGTAGDGKGKQGGKEGGIAPSRNAEKGPQKGSVSPGSEEMRDLQMVRQMNRQMMADETESWRIKNITKYQINLK